MHPDGSEQAGLVCVQATALTYRWYRSCGQESCTTCGHGCFAVGGTGVELSAHSFTLFLL